VNQMELSAQRIIIAGPSSDLSFTGPQQREIWLDYWSENYVDHVDC